MSRHNNLKETAIEKKDLIEYVESESDFGFELKVLKILQNNNIISIHSGLYQDPNTDKTREFDLRGVITKGKYRVRMAIECKNIKEYFPVLLNCVPRDKLESRHQFVSINEDLRNFPNIFDFSSNKYRFNLTELHGEKSFYKPNEPVAKGIVQVGRLAKENKIFAKNDEIYEKWSQCLASLHEIITERAYLDGQGEDKNVCYIMTIPILVVPNNRLWVIEYDLDGNCVAGPKTVQRCSYSIQKKFKHKFNGPFGSYICNKLISHMEIMTCEGLDDFINRYLSSEDKISYLFGNLEDDKS